MSLATDKILDVGYNFGGAEPGTTVYDKSRIKRPYAEGGSPTHTQLASGQWVWDFDGSVDSLSSAYVPSYGLVATDFTLEAWVNPTYDATEQYATIIRKSTDTVFCYNAQGATPQVRFAYMKSGPTWVWGTLVNMNPYGQYTHVIITFDHTLGGANTVKTYIDGAETLSEALTGDVLDGKTSGFYLGGNPGGYAIGQQCKWRVYRCALRPPQVRARYNSTKWLFGVAS